MRFPAYRLTDNLYPARDRGSMSAVPESPFDYPGFKPHREIYLLHGELGRIVEISMRYIRYTYYTADHLRAVPPARAMLFATFDEYVDEIPLQVLSDKEIFFRLFTSKYQLKERSASFGDLSEDQTRGLERFISRNALIPSSSPEERQSSGRPGCPGVSL